MVVYKITCIDIDGDDLKVEIENGVATIKDAKKFTISVDSNKIKRFVDGVSGIQSILEDFGFKELNIEKVD